MQGTYLPKVGTATLLTSLVPMHDITTMSTMTTQTSMVEASLFIFDTLHSHIAYIFHSHTYLGGVQHYSKTTDSSPTKH